MRFLIFQFAARMLAPSLKNKQSLAKFRYLKMKYVFDLSCFFPHFLFCKFLLLYQDLRKRLGDLLVRFEEQQIFFENQMKTKELECQLADAKRAQQNALYEQEKARLSISEQNLVMVMVRIPK